MSFCSCCLFAFFKPMFTDNLFQQGAQAHCGYLCQRSYSTMGEAEIDHLHVPACRIATGKAQNRQAAHFYFGSWTSCTVFAICIRQNWAFSTLLQVSTWIHVFLFTSTIWTLVCIVMWGYACLDSIILHTFMMGMIFVLFTVTICWHRELPLWDHLYMCSFLRLVLFPGIQFPTDHYNDPFLSSVWVCVCACAGSGACACTCTIWKDVKLLI